MITKGEFLLHKHTSLLTKKKVKYLSHPSSVQSVFFPTEDLCLLSLTGCYFDFEIVGTLYSWSLILYGTSSDPLKTTAQRDIIRGGAQNEKPSKTAKTTKQSAPTTKPGRLILYYVVPVPY